MGSTGSKYVIALGFALIFFSLFFTTWKATSPANKAAYLAAKNEEIALRNEEPIAPALQKLAFPAEDAVAQKLGLTTEVFKDKLGTTYNDAKKEFENNGDIKKWNEDCDKAAKGELDSYKEYVKDYGNFIVRQQFEARRNAFRDAKDLRDMQNEVDEERWQVGEYCWHRGFILYFGVAIVTIGFLMLAVGGEGNEKLGALIGLAAVLFFIANYFGAGAIR